MRAQFRPPALNCELLADLYPANETFDLKESGQVVENLFMGTMALLESAPTQQVEVLKTPTLGELMTAHRGTVNLGLETLSEQSGLPIAQIERVEAGQHELDSDELAELLRCYDISSGIGRMSSPVVEISLEGGWVAMGSARRRSSDKPAADENLISYLSLVYSQCEFKAGAQIPLKQVDLSLLRSALALRRDDVSAEIDRMTGRIPAGLRRNRSLLTVAAATGIAVAAGALILIPGPTTTTLSSSPVDVLVTVSQSVEAIETTSESSLTVISPQIDIGTPLVIERSAAEAEAATSGAQSSAVAINPQIEIGTAVVIERSVAEATAEDAATNSSNS